MDDKRSPSTDCKKAGLKSLEELSTITAVPRSTLNAWPTTKPKLWQAVLKGAAQIKMAISIEREECAKICEETWVEPGDLQTDNCHEAADKIRDRGKT